MAAILVSSDDKIDIKKLSEGVSKSLPQYARPLFVRLVKSLKLTGTYKLKKTELQEEGFDINRTEDDIYYMGPRDLEYRKLDQQTYNTIGQNLQLSKL